jgi:hypothetical protein
MPDENDRRPGDRLGENSPVGRLRFALQVLRLHVSSGSKPGFHSLTSTPSATLPVRYGMKRTRACLFVSKARSRSVANCPLILIKVESLTTKSNSTMLGVLTTPLTSSDCEIVWPSCFTVLRTPTTVSAVSPEPKTPTTTRPCSGNAFVIVPVMTSGFPNPPFKFCDLETTAWSAAFRRFAAPSIARRLARRGAAQQGRKARLASCSYANLPQKTCGEAFLM